MRKIFLDVGGHLGQTLEEVTKPIYYFDIIYCFEPFPPHVNVLREKFKNYNVKILEYGLSNTTSILDFYSDGLDDMGASVKKREGEKKIVTKCRFKRASDFFRDQIDESDMVIMKLNCEGSECDILNDLIDSNEISKIDNVMIDFDVRKYPHLVHEEPKLMKRMADIGFTNFSLCDQVMKGRTHQKRIAHWLRSLPWHDQFRPRANWIEHLRGMLRY